MKEVLKAEEAKPVESSDTIFVMNPITELSAKPKSKLQGMLYEDESGFVRKTDSDVVKVVDILNYNETSFDVMATVEDFLNNFIMGCIDQGMRLYIMCNVDEITFDPKMGRFSRMYVTAYNKRWITYFDSKEEGIIHFELLADPEPDYITRMYCEFYWDTEREEFHTEGITASDFENHVVIGHLAGTTTYFTIHMISAIYAGDYISQMRVTVDDQFFGCIDCRGDRLTFRVSQPHVTNDDYPG